MDARPEPVQAPPPPPLPVGFILTLAVLGVLIVGGISLTEKPYGEPFR